MGSAHNLPVHLTSFVGRKQEQAEVLRLLGITRLLTLIGAGGVGKTRLALRVAESLVDEYQDGVWAVELAPLSDGTHVPQVVAAALAIREAPGQPLIESLAASLSAKRLLLVLDNCEHLLPACAALVEHLLRACPLVRVLATSREALAIAGETAWRVPSLSLPDLPARSSNEDVSRSEAIELFVERARAALPSFALTDHNGPAVAEVCRRLDGMPLAVELAAARVALLTPEQIEARLGDRFHLLRTGSRSAPTRQQTLWATVAWSYDLLSADEQHLFERLSIFAGGWTLEAVEAVGGAEELEIGDVLDLLGRLVAKSLVMVEPGEQGAMRYRLLDTLRQFAQERLQARGESAEVAERHAAYFIAYAEEAARTVFGPQEQHAVRRLGVEHENVRAALRWLIDSGAVEQGQRLGGAFGMFWLNSSALAEGRAWLRELLTMPGGDQPTAERATCLFDAALLAQNSGDFVVARTLGTEALAIWRRLGRDGHAARALFQLGSLTRMEGDFAAARSLLQEAVALSHATGSPGVEAAALVALADLATSQGDFQTARESAEAARARTTALGWGRALVSALRALADACFEQGDDRAARMVAEECVGAARAQRLGPGFLISPLVSLGRSATAQHDFAPAHAALGEALHLAQAIGNQVGTGAALYAFAYLAATRGQFERAICLETAAGPRVHGGGGTQTPVSARVQRQLTAAARSLGPDRTHSAQLKGRMLALADAIAYALAAEVSVEQAGETAATPVDGLTPREREVAALVARGLSNQEIATQLVISERTVESHVRNLLGKLALRSRAELAAWVVKHQPGSEAIK
jgi:predicted ATPase/DNA-binding CsgD family transcriptional regulator